MKILRLHKTLIFLLLSALGLFLASSAFAADPYTIVISESSANTNREVIKVVEHVGAYDTFSQEVIVVNTTNTGHSIRLQKVEVLEDSFMKEHLTFTFIGNTGGSLTLTKDDFDNENWSEFFTIGNNESDSFTLETRVSDLDNEHQGDSFKIRYTFEVIRTSELDKDDDRDQPTTDRPATLPQAGDTLGMYLLWIGLIMGSFLVMLVGYRRKQKRDDGEVRNR